MSDNLMEENIGGTASEDVIASQMSDENIKEEEVSTQISEPLDPNALLEVRNLKKYFPAKKDFFGRTISYLKAVDDVSFKIEKGTTLGIVGESGCGKTTLGRTILRLQPATGGEIYFDGKDINKLKTAEMNALRPQGPVAPSPSTTS